MSKREIIWKDPERRHVMGLKPGNGGDHPVGVAEIDDHILDGLVGGRTEAMSTAGCCNGFSSDNRCGTNPVDCASTTPSYTCSGAVCH